MMATEVMVTVEDTGHLVGTTSADAEDLCELIGGVYRCVLTEPSNGKISKQRLFWKVCSVIAENHAGGFHKDEVAHILKIEAGHCRPVRLDDGTYYRVAKSVSLNKMTDAGFSDFLDRALKAACDKFGDELAAAAWSVIAPEPVRLAA